MTQLLPVCRILLVLVVVLSLTRVQCDAQECDAADETCSSSSNFRSRSSCDVRTPAASCAVPLSLYSDGGTAVAYRPHAPESHTICDAMNYTVTKYRPAGWAWTRSTYRQAPQLSLHLRLLGCASSDDESCCCRALPPSTSTKVEIWQARPDGTYSSLRDQHEALGDCRASANGSVVFETVAPGSVGSLGGLGGRNSMPYGPPVIHVMVQVPGYASILVDLPVSIDMTTYRQASFWGPDFRGAAWVRSPITHNAHYQITAWRGDPEANRIEMEVDILLPQQATKTTKTTSIATELCPSFAYGLPSSFFFEPIAVCAPSMLNFFAL